MENPQLLDAPTKRKKSRRIELLPLWIKVFAWLFALIALFVPGALFFGLMGKEFDLMLYGLKTKNPLSTVGLFILALCALKGMVAFGLLTEKKWAINAAKADGYLGAALCGAMIALPYFTQNEAMKAESAGLMLQLLPLLFFLKKITEIEYAWEHRVGRKGV